MISQAIKPKFKVGEILKSPAGKEIKITRTYHSDGSNFYHFIYSITGEEGYHALFEYQLLRANNR